jgi:hypothetical protein
LLPGRREDRLTQMAVRCQAASIAHAMQCGRGTRAASFSRSSSGESRMPMVPSDHGWVNV